MKNEIKIFALFVMFVTASVCDAQALPDSPSHSKAFVAASAGAAVVTILDSYTTSLIRKNWIANDNGWGRKSECLDEGGEPFFYGKEPTVARAWGVGAAKIVVGETVAWWLYKHHHRRLWIVPFVYETSAITGVVRNFENCQ